ncbi:bifunctional phosphoribosylaminoimidazolecarboxamide formyltransferase/IMP cyclohydrolase [bacterium]|nr:bifunctional phosphoribosylaminoimidazolecarboxamide formyltransferase/IMP cyclohydrolase [bacterium]
MKRRAFISVYDKASLEDFARNLVEKFDYEIVSMGETYELLKSAGIEVIDIKDFAGTPNVLSGKFNALTETILAGILQNTPDVEALNQVEKFAIKNFDMVVINMKPFEKIALSSGNIDDIVKQVDIVESTLLRAAAKNYKNVTVICDKVDYYVALNANDYGRMKLAAKAFKIVSNYDNAVCSILSDEIGEKPFKNITLEKICDMSHGENAHQKARMYKGDTMVAYEILNEKELSYNDILNLTEVTNIVSEFYDMNAVAIARHTKPCGVAFGKSIYEAYSKAFDCDPMSSYYGTVAFSNTVDIDTAKHVNSMSVEAVIAPDYDEKAKELLCENPDLKIVKLITPLKEYKKMYVEEIAVTPFAILIQDRNSSELNKEMFKVVTKEKPSADQVEDAIFGWKVAKYAKTNAALIVKNGKTLAISQGHTNTISAVESVLNMAADAANEAVLVSDCAISAEDCIYAAIQNRVGLIIQPGGTVKDSRLIELCDKYGMAMITTGIRNYTH